MTESSVGLSSDVRFRPGPMTDGWVRPVLTTNTKDYTTTVPSRHTHQLRRLKRVTNMLRRSFLHHGNGSGSRPTTFGTGTRNKDRLFSIRSGRLKCLKKHSVLSSSGGSFKESYDFFDLHTEPERNKMTSFTPGSAWESHTTRRTDSFSVTVVLFIQGDSGEYTEKNPKHQVLPRSRNRGQRP